MIPGLPRLCYARGSGRLVLVTATRSALLSLWAVDGGIVCAETGEHMTSPTAHPAAEHDAALWLPRLRDGDRTTFDLLVKLYWSAIARFCWKRVRVSDVDDLTQLVFVSAYRAVRNGKGPATSDTTGWRRYLLACARNQVIDYWRRNDLHPPLQSLEDLIGEEGNWESVMGIANASEAADSDACPEEHSVAIFECMGKLDVPSRVACWLVFVENRSRRETARLLEKPESSLRGLLLDAIGSLSRCLKGKGVVAAG